jgi:hypothetical protein
VRLIVVFPKTSTILAGLMQRYNFSVASNSYQGVKPVPLGEKWNEIENSSGWSLSRRGRPLVTTDVLDCLLQGAASDKAAYFR